MENNADKDSNKVSWKNYFSSLEVPLVDLKNPRKPTDNRARIYGYHGYCLKDGKVSEMKHHHFGISKDELLNLMSNPEANEKVLRDLSRHLYNVSPQYKRTIQYFANMTPLNYTIRPFKFDKEKYQKDNGKTFKTCYKRACDFLEILNLKHEMIKAKIIAWREDVFYGYIYKNKDSVYIRTLNPDYCAISGICDGCYVYSFDFSYFDRFGNDLERELKQYGEEFVLKYQNYAKDRNNYRWQELDHKNEFCIKVNEDSLKPVIPFLGCLPALYDIEDYKDIKLSSSEIENYKALGLKVPIGSDGQPLMSHNEMDNFYEMILNILPENVGLYMTPTDLQEITFERDNSSNSVSEAVADYFNDVGVSSLLFGGDSQSSTSLKISLMADEALAFSLNRQIERVVNRLLKGLSGTIKFQINILDVSYYHQKDMHDLYLKDAQYGIPTKSAIVSSLGFDQSILEGMCFTENDFLNLVDEFKPLQSSYTTSSADSSENNGRPTSEESGNDLTDSGESTKERDVNDV